jgi:hypothetical protein
VKEANMSRMAPYGVGEERERRSIALGVPGRGIAIDVSIPQLAQRVAIGVALVTQIALLLISLVPATQWASYGQPADGPIPHSLSPLVAGVFYLAPALIGALCRRWQVAVALAALPALLDLGIFAVAAAERLGPFYLAQDIHAPYTVGTLELFAVLGALGWLTRSAILLVLADLAQRQETSRS